MIAEDKSKSISVKGVPGTFSELVKSCLEIENETKGGHRADIHESRSLKSIFARIRILIFFV